jgi:hypothetical protein
MYAMWDWLFLASGVALIVVGHATAGKPIGPDNDRAP